MVLNYTAIDDLIKKNQPQSVPVSHSKEGEPVRKADGAFEIGEVVEHEPSKEVKPFITVKHETIKLPPDLSEIGLKAVETTDFPTYKNIKLPLADEEVMTGLHAPITTSLRWLATLAWYLLLQAHLTLRIVHGKVVRVARRG